MQAQSTRNEGIVASRIRDVVMIEAEGWRSSALERHADRRGAIVVNFRDKRSRRKPWRGADWRGGDRACWGAAELAKEMGRGGVA